MCLVKERDTNVNKKNNEAMKKLKYKLDYFIITSV